MDVEWLSGCQKESKLWLVLMRTLQSGFMCDFVAMDNFLWYVVIFDTVSVYMTPKPYIII